MAFRKTEIEKFPKYWNIKTDDYEYWSNLQFPVTFQEYGPVDQVDICPVVPHYIAASVSNKVQIYNPDTKEIFRNLSKFNERTFGVKFRSDGQLICVGSENGSVLLFETSSKNPLKTFKGHSAATHRCNFLSNKHELVSFSDDKSIGLFNLTSENVYQRFKEHTDYVRAGCILKTSSDLFISGSYDHSIRLWDKRRPTSVVCMDHQSPVESVIMFPSSSIVASAGGCEIKLWDLTRGGRLLSVISPHSKTITWLGFATNYSRVVSGSLDRQIKFHDISNMKTVHSISFPSAVLTAAVAPNDSFICAGLTDGLVQFLHRKSSKSFQDETSLSSKQRRATNHKYLQFTEFTPQMNDIIVKQTSWDKELRHDYFFRKFEYSKALDQVLKPYVQRKHPEYAYSVLMELQRRDGLKIGLGGRDEKSLNLLLQFLIRYINDPRFSAFLTEIVDLLIDIYASFLGKWPSIDKQFVEIRGRIDREILNIRYLLCLQGALDLILSGASKNEPQFCLEEKLLASKTKKCGD